MFRRCLTALVVLTFATGASGCDAIDVLTGAKEEPQQKKPRPRLPPPAGVSDLERIGRPMIPVPGAELPMVGPEGEDPYGYPYARPDKVALAELARLRRFDELEKHLQAVVDAAHEDFHKELWVVTAFDAFKANDPELTAALSQWVKQSPESWIALLARGTHNQGRAWAIRGHASADETGHNKMDTFRTMSEEAMRDTEAALTIAPNKAPALSRKTEIALGLNYSLQQHRELLDAQLAECPDCCWPHRQYLYSMVPRWSGPEGGKIMMAHAASLQSELARNPRFEILTRFPVLDQCRTLRTQKKYAEADKMCAEAAGEKEDLVVMEVRADVSRLAERAGEAAKLFDEILAKWPQNENAVRHGYQARVALEHHKEAAELLLTWRRLDPTNEDLEPPVRFYMHKLWFMTKEALDKGDVDTAGQLADLAFAINPEHRGFLEMRGRVYARKGIDPLREQAKNNPDDLNVMLTLDYALAQHRSFPEIVEHWTRFIERNPENGRAYYERGGAYVQQSKTGEANLDIVKACDLGYEPACERAKVKGLR